MTCWKFVTLNKAVPLIEGATVCLLLALKSGIADNICLGSLSKKD